MSLCKYLYLYRMLIFYFDSTAYFTQRSRRFSCRVTEGHFQNCSASFRFWRYLIAEKWLCIAMIIIPTTEIFVPHTGCIFPLQYLRDSRKNQEKRYVKLRTQLTRHTKINNQPTKLFLNLFEKLTEQYS